MIYFEDKIGWRLHSLVAVQLYAFPALIKIPIIIIIIIIRIFQQDKSFNKNIAGFNACPA